MEMKKRKTGVWFTLYFLVIIGVMFLINIAEGPGNLDTLETIEDSTINAWGAIQLMLGRKEAYGNSTFSDVYRLDNGYAVVPDMDSRLEGVYVGIPTGKQLANEIGAEFLFVMAPEKVLREDVPFGIIDYSPEKHDDAVAFMSTTGYEYLDMKQVLLEAPEDWYSYFYKSDHHWNNEAALLCTEKIIQWISDKGYDIKAFSLSDFEKTDYPLTELGSAGRFSGIYYGGVDDYSLYTPVNQGTYKVTLPTEDSVTEGTFDETVLVPKVLTEYDFDTYAYYNYFGTDRDYTEIVNLENTDAPDVLMVKDSFAVPVAAMLSNYCHELDVVDLRYVKDDAEEYIRGKQPDIIIYLFGAGNFGEVLVTTP